jgi:alpha-beta hydrolase superfamily lysophospholipase
MSVEPTTATIDNFVVDAWKYRRYEPAGEPRGVIVCLHGIQSHGGWYQYSSQKLCAAGFRVLYLDRRGSGLNDKSRGDTPSFGRLLDDIADFLRSPVVTGNGDKRNLPVFLHALSWGGKLAVALQRWQRGLIDGLILLCPGLFPHVGVSLWQRLRIMAARTKSPTRLFPIPLNDPDLFTASPRWRDFIRNDPLALRQATARFMVASALLDRYLRKAPKYVNVPTLLLLAGQDRIIRNDKTHHYFHKFATTDKNVITYAQAHHTLEFEPDPDIFLGEIIRWLERHCGTAATRAHS